MEMSVKGLDMICEEPNQYLIID